MASRAAHLRNVFMAASSIVIDPQFSSVNVKYSLTSELAVAPPSRAFDAVARRHTGMTLDVRQILNYAPGWSACHARRSPDCCCGFTLDRTSID
jgi:hypothetical protein